MCREIHEQNPNEIRGGTILKTEFIPDRLISIRKQRGLNKSQAAARIGLSPIGYLRYEQGQRIPSPQMIEIIALKLYTSVDYLTGSSDDPSANMLLISKNNDPELFEILIDIETFNPNAANRLLAYAENLKMKLEEKNESSILTE